jgi:hypothetical protein
MQLKNMMIIKSSQLLHAIGLLEFDELFILIGYGMTVATTIFAGNLAIRTSFVANFNSQRLTLTTSSYSFDSIAVGEVKVNINFSTNG